MNELLTAIDVGTTKVCTLIAEVVEPEVLHIVGAGHATARGLRRGVVTDVSEAIEAIGESIERAEESAGAPIERAYVGIAGSHITVVHSKGVAAVRRDRGGITEEDIERALDAARAIAIPHNREIIHTVPRQYTVDDQPGVRNPLGMSAYRLEVEAQIVTGASTSVQNLVKCVHAHGIEIEELVLEPLATGEAVLTEAEKEMGVALADIGGGTTDIAIFLDGALWHAAVLDVGSSHLTQDVAIGLRMPFTMAEELKVRYGHAQPQRVPGDEMVMASTFGDGDTQTISRHMLAEILEARAEEICDLVMRAVKRSGYDGLLPAGVVITGGGAQLAGLRELSRQVFNLPVRMGVPNGNPYLPDMDPALRRPQYTTAVGLLLWALRQQSAPHSYQPPQTPMVQRILRWLRTLLPE